MFTSVLSSNVSCNLALEVVMVSFILIPIPSLVIMTSLSRAMLPSWPICFVISPTFANTERGAIKSTPSINASRLVLCDVNGIAITINVECYYRNATTALR